MAFGMGRFVACACVMGTLVASGVWHGAIFGVGHVAIKGPFVGCGVSVRCYLWLVLLWHWPIYCVGCGIGQFVDCGS